MSQKKSVFLKDLTLDICHAMSEQGAGKSNFSGSINAVFEQFSIFVDDNLPELTERQWNAFYCAFNGRLCHQSILEECKILHFTLDQNYQYDSQVQDFLGDKEQAVEFISSVNEWPVSTKLAVIYKARSYWRGKRLVDA